MIVHKGADGGASIRRRSPIAARDSSRRRLGGRSFLFAGLIAALALWFGAACRADSWDRPSDVWFGIYVGTTKIGVSHIWSRPDKFEERDATLWLSDTTTSLVAFGTTIEQKVIGRTWSDPATSRPLYETVAITSGGSSTDVAARYFDDHIAATLTSGGSVTHKSVPIPSGVQLTSSDVEHGIISQQVLQRGQVFSETAFDPLALRLETYTITVTDLGRTLTDSQLGSVKGLAVCQAVGPAGELTIYLDASGHAIRIDMPAGLIMRRDPTASMSPAGVYSPPTDFAIATSVNQTGMAIARPRDCRYLKVQLASPDGPAREIEVRTVEPAPAYATIDQAAADPSLKPYLADAAYLSLDDAALADRARGIGGTSTNLYELALKTRDWVYANMKATATLGLPRSAASILQDPRGVCRDYAILYTALARAQGIPTRVCVGLVAFRDRFYYHAWAESYVGGRTGWLPVDPTMEAPTVDATHIAITRGGPEAIFDVAPQIGRLKARILDAAY